MTQKEYDFPVEVLDLPSKGLIYSKDHPLSSGQITIKLMTAKEEDILSSQNLIKKGIVLEKNATLVNHTGASTGNIFSLNGTMYIGNGGKYIHKTIRGNSYIISKLEVDSGSRKGMVEFDVPGTAGYTLSLSGRKFGSLVLSANESMKKYFDVWQMNTYC